MDNILSWNVGGLDSKGKQFEVKKFPYSHKGGLFCGSDSYSQRLMLLKWEPCI